MNADDLFVECIIVRKDGTRQLFGHSMGKERGTARGSPGRRQRVVSHETPSPEDRISGTGLISKQPNSHSISIFTKHLSLPFLYHLKALSGPLSL